MEEYLIRCFHLVGTWYIKIFCLQIDLAHGSPNGYPPVTWMPVPRQQHHILQTATNQQWIDDHLLKMQQQHQRLAPIVCSKESTVSILLLSGSAKFKCFSFRY